MSFQTKSTLIFVTSYLVIFKLNGNWNFYWTYFSNGKKNQIFARSTPICHEFRMSIDIFLQHRSMLIKIFSESKRVRRSTLNIQFDQNLRICAGFSILIMKSDTFPADLKKKYVQPLAKFVAQFYSNLPVIFYLTSSLNKSLNFTNKYYKFWPKFKLASIKQVTSWLRSNRKHQFSAINSKVCTFMSFILVSCSSYNFSWKGENSQHIP